MTWKVIPYYPMNHGSTQVYVLFNPTTGEYSRGRSGRLREFRDQELAERALSRMRR